MFYSQTFLARKGPLGTVWCAAHMQSRLKKSHYTSTDVSSTVDRIMFPEVPLALRMSSHLLLGVVRIYAKQVDILYDDCNAVLIRLRKAFAAIDLNLPEDTRQAPVHAITLPETFDLDAMDLDDQVDLDRFDDHLRSLEDITLVDQIPIGTEIYVSISFDEDIMMDSSHPTEVPNASATAVDQNVVPPAAMQNNEDVPNPSTQVNQPETRHDDITGSENLDGVLEDPGPSNDAEMHDLSHSNDNRSEIVPEIEVMREAVPDSSVNPPPHSLNCGNHIAEPQASLDQVMNEKETLSPIFENAVNSGGQTPPFQPSSGPQASVASLHEGPVNNSPVSFAIRSTPPVQKPKARPRKRKQYYDEAPVLTNKFMKKALEDPSDLLRKRRKIPHSALGKWKLENILRKENVFFEPSITGLCSDLRNIFNKDSVSTKLISVEEARPDTEVVRSPAPETPGLATEASPHSNGAEFQTPTHDNVQEIEILRHAVNNDEGNTLPEFIPSPRVTPSDRRDDISPSPTQTLRSTPVPFTEKDTSTVFSEERTGLVYTGLSDVPELNFEEADFAFFFSKSKLSSPVRPAEPEASFPSANSSDSDLFFLEADNTTPPASSQGVHGIDSLSVRTRAVAQYLKKQSPITPFSETSECLSLNKILRGKTRKLCARMFFETLVLKSNALLDVEQEVPYGDITLTVSPALSKAQI